MTDTRQWSLSELTYDREKAAAKLQAAIAGLGEAWQRYAEATRIVEERLGGADLARGLEVPIILHLAQAGLCQFLERKLQGTPASLRTLCEEQHGTRGAMGNG